MSEYRSKNARRVDPLGRHPSLAVRLARRKRCLVAAFVGGAIVLFIVGLALGQIEWSSR